MLKLKQAQLKMLETKRQSLFQRNQVRPRSSSHENVAMSQAQEMMMRHSLNDGQGANTNIDPFLASGQPGETHNRQESADSGLGMGSNFNLGSIPEDMGLETMDTADLDTTLTESNQVTHLCQNYNHKAPHHSKKCIIADNWKSGMRLALFPIGFEHKYTI